MFWLGCLASAAMLLALMAPALWNGFPLIFPDVGGYLDRPIYGTLGIDRSALYGLFLYAGTPFVFWPKVVIQSALAIWLIVLTMRAHDLGGRPWLAIYFVLMMAFCTSLAVVFGSVNAGHFVLCGGAGDLSVNAGGILQRVAGAKVQH